MYGNKVDGAIVPDTILSVMHEDLDILDSADESGLHRNSDIPLGKGSIGENSLREGRPMRDAAVLVPLVYHEAQWQILYIRRASNERDRHSGQVAFPGGAAEKRDASPEKTALRETFEEIGVSKERIQIVTKLEPYITVSRYLVTPVVGIVQWPSPLKLEASEVARAFLIPLDWLKQRVNFTLRARRDMDLASSRRHPIIVYEPYDGEVLWGASARMTINFIKQLEQGTLILPTDASTPRL